MNCRNTHHALTEKLCKIQFLRKPQFGVIKNLVYFFRSSKPFKICERVKSVSEFTELFWQKACPSYMPFYLGKESTYIIGE